MRTREEIEQGTASNLHEVKGEGAMNGMVLISCLEVLLDIRDLLIKHEKRGALNKYLND